MHLRLIAIVDTYDQSVPSLAGLDACSTNVIDAS